MDGLDDGLSFMRRDVHVALEVQVAIGKDMGNPWVSNSQPIPIPTSNPYP